MTRILLFVATYILIFITYASSASAFFAQEYKKNTLFGVFKKNRTADVYLGFDAGFFFHTWSQIFASYLSPSDSLISTYSQKIPNQFFKSMNGKGTFSFGFQIGFHEQDSKFRHEIGFEWYTMATNAIAIGDEHMIVDGRDYSYATMNGMKVATAGTYADIYRLTYNIYYDFENAFKLLKTNWDVYVGGGVGPAFIDGGMYANSVINGTEGSASIDDRDPSSMKAKEYRINRVKAIAAGYQVSIGAIIYASRLQRQWELHLERRLVR